MSTTAEQLAAYKAQVDAKYRPGYRGPETPKAIRARERDEDRKEPRWLEVSPDGVVVGCHSYDRHDWATEEQVWASFYPRKRDREQARRDGYTVRRDDAAHTGFNAFRTGVWGDE